MAKLVPALKKTIALPGKNMREKADPLNLFLPKDAPQEAAAPAPAGDSGMNLGRRGAARRSSYNYGSGLSGGVR